MKDITCIDDLRQLARRKVPRAFFDYADSGSYQRGNAARQPRRPARRSSCASACWWTSPSAASPPPSSGRRWRRRSSLAPIGLCGMQHGDGEILSARAAERGRHSVHALHHVDLLDRGRGGGDQQAVLVPALRHPRPRLLQGHPGARGGGEMQRAGAHRRPAGARPAPPRHQERHDGAAGNPPQEHHRHRHQAGLGLEHARRASARPSAISPAT